MGAIKDPRATMLFEFETGTVYNRRVHVVGLEAPPRTLKITRQKNVQKIITTKGHVHNHGLEGLPIITASGIAYQPRNAVNEGFNPNSKFAGLEYLNSAYVASGRVSSSPNLTSTIKTSLSTTVTNPTQNVNTLTQYINTIKERTATLTNLSNKIQAYGTTSSTGEFIVDTNQLPNTQLTQANVDSLRNMSLSELERNPALNISVKQSATYALTNMTTTNVDVVYAQMSQYTQQDPLFQPTYDKFDIFYNKYKNENSKLTAPNLDPSIFTYLQRDPFILQKTGASQTIGNGLTTSQENARKQIKSAQGLGTKDWIITVIMYFQDMIYEGHFENFSLVESAEVNGLWSWEFTYVAHQSFLLKSNNVIPFDRAFDTSLTEVAHTTSILNLNDRFDVLDYILALGSNSTTQKPIRIGTDGRLEITQVASRIEPTDSSIIVNRDTPVPERGA